MAGGSERRPLDLTPDAPVQRLQGAPRVQRIRWALVLVWFMRLVALAWLAKGLLAWAQILGVVDGGQVFEARATGEQATVIYFAVIDLVAAVGLWLTSTWGGVLWLLATMSHLILTVFFPKILPADPVLIGSFVMFIAVYLLISWLSAAEIE